MTGTVVSKAVLSARGGAVTSAEPFPALFLATPKAQTRFWEFFTAHIRNKHTRAAYLAAAGRFSAWCEGRRLVLEQVQPVHVAGYVEQLSGELAAPSVKQHLAALRMLFDWLVVGQVIPFNPAHAVRGPKHSAKRGKTPVLSEEQARTLIQSIDGQPDRTARPGVDHADAVHVRPGGGGDEDEGPGFCGGGGSAVGAAA